MTNEIYSEVQTRLPSVKLFFDAEINIVVKPCLKREKGQLGLENLAQFGDFDEYHIEKLTYESTQSGAAFVRVSEAVVAINKMLVDNDIQNWNIFYLYKELIQRLVKDRSEGFFNYFRGQFDNWPLVPSLFRENTKKSFIETFDHIYSDIAKEYPDVLTYVPYKKENAEARAEQLAMLQHYGMRTSLLDITQNPFIALQFMVLGFSEHGRAHTSSLDMYCIDEERHAESNIFVAVVKNDRNKRIKAQKGAFFDYDYLSDIKQTRIKRIPRLKIRVAFDITDIEKSLKKQRQEFQELTHFLNSPDVDLPATKSKDSMKRQLEDNIKEIDNLLEKSPDLMKSRLSYLISRDISQKLREYFYLEKNLFPDFDKYITYLQEKNIEPREKLNQ